MNIMSTFSLLFFMFDIFFPLSINLVIIIIIIIIIIITVIIVIVNLLPTPSTRVMKSSVRAMREGNP